MPPRLSYRARVSVVPLDPAAAAVLSAVPDTHELHTSQLHARTADEVAGSDMVVFFSADAGVVTREPLVDVAGAARDRGLLVAAVVTGAFAVGDGEPDERQGLAALREAVDMLVLTTDESLLADLLDILRGGRAGARTALRVASGVGAER